MKCEGLLGTIATFAIIGLLVPMADGCHKHAKVKKAGIAIPRLAASQIQHPPGAEPKNLGVL